MRVCVMVRVPLLFVGTVAFSLTIGCQTRREENLESRSHSAKEESNADILLVLIPNTIDFGRLAPKSECEQIFWLENCGSETVHVTTVKASCECLTVQLEQNQIEPGKKVRATVKLCLKDEPEFAGKLAATITGFSGEGASPKQLFELKIRAEVPPK